MDSPSPVKKYQIKEKVAARISRESQPQILNLEAYILFMVSLDVDLPLSAFSSSYFFFNFLKSHIFIKTNQDFGNCRRSGHFVN